MSTKITNLPWHVNVDAEGYQETSDAIAADWDAIVEFEQEYGALFYAGVANEAADMMGYPEDIKTEVSEDAQRTASEWVRRVRFDESEGSAEALYGLVADAHDHLEAYREGFGQVNVEPLAEHVNAIREAWRSNRK